MSFQDLEKCRGIFKFTKKVVFVPYLRVNYLVFLHSDTPDFFSVLKDYLSIVSSTLHYCLVLLPSTFSEIIIDFDQDSFSHFRILLKRKKHCGKKCGIALVLCLQRTLSSMRF